MSKSIAPPKAPKQQTINQYPVSSNVLGSPWPDIYGVRESQGTIINWLNHRVVEQTTSTGGKGGGGGSVSTGETHYRDVGVGLTLDLDCLTGIYYGSTQIWSGALWRAASARVATATVGVGGATVSTLNGTANFYWGTDDQTPDPYLQAFVPDLPYRRGRSHIVLQNFMLGSSDNLDSLSFVGFRIPPTPPGAGYTPTSQRIDGLTGLAGDFAVAADATGYTGNKNRRYRLNITTGADADHALVSYGDMEQIDTAVELLAVAKGVAFDLGTFGITATLTWTGAMADDASKIFTFDVLLRGPGSVGGNANPICVVYEKLTDPTRGISMRAELVDTASFVSAAAGITFEPCGMAYVHTSRDTVKKMLEDILGDVQACVPVIDGAFTARLLRSGGVDWTLQDDDILDPLESERAVRDPDLVTKAVAHYYDASRRFTLTPVNVSGAGGTLVDDLTLDLTFDRATDPTVAKYFGLLKFALKRQPVPIRTLTAGRNAFVIQPGDIVTINAPNRGFNNTLNYRIGPVLPTGSGDESIELQLTRDIFGSLPREAGQIGGVPGGVGVSGTPELPQNNLFNVIELPTEIAPDESKRFVLFATRPAPDAQGMSIYASLDGVDYSLVMASAPFHAGGTLVSASWPRFTMDRQAYIEFNAASDDINNFGSLSDVNWFGFQMMVLVGTGNSATLYAAKELFPQGGTKWRLTGLLGPLADTVAAAWGGDTPIWIFRVQPAYFIPGQPSWTIGTPLHFKAVPFGGRTSPSLAGAPDSLITVTGRAACPRQTGELLANNRGEVIGPTYSDDIVLSWSLRNRLHGLGYETNPSPFDPTVLSEVDECDVEIRVAGALKRTITASVKHSITTTTVNDDGATTQDFALDSVADLQPGFRCSVIHAGIEWFGRIRLITGSTVTLFDGLLITPITGDVFKCYEQVAAVYDAAANAVDNGALAATVVARVFSKRSGLRSLVYQEATVIKV